MLQLTATAKGKARAVSTKYGEKWVLDCLGEDGQEYTIWRPDGDQQLPKVGNGERLSLGVDSKGKCHLLETLADKVGRPAPIPAPAPAPEYNAHNGRSAEIADYVSRLGKLYGYCYQTAKQTLENETENPEDYRATATTFFIQAVKHFDL